MGPATFVPFFAASAGAGATLVGLLFVAVSIAPERVFGQEARFEHQLIASSAFTALVNAFFISLGALIPSSSSIAAGTVVLIMGGVALVNSVTSFLNLLRRPGAETTRSARWQSIWLLIIGMALYGFEVLNAISLIRTPADVSPLYSICGLLVGVYGFGIVRAWQLLGADRRGFLSFLIPLLLRAQHNLNNVAKTTDSPTEPGEPQPATIDTRDASRNQSDDRSMGAS